MFRMPAFSFWGIGVRFLAIDALCWLFTLGRLGRFWVGAARRGLRCLLGYELNRPFVNDGGSQGLPRPHRGPPELHWAGQLDDAVLAVLTRGNTRNHTESHGNVEVWRPMTRFLKASALVTMKILEMLEVQSVLAAFLKVCGLIIHGHLWPWQDSWMKKKDLISLINWDLCDELV